MKVKKPMALQRTRAAHRISGGAPISLETFDKAFWRRLGIAITVSLAVNLVIFGYAGMLGHRFLQAIRVREYEAGKVTVRRIFLPADKVVGSQPLPSAAAPPSIGQSHP